MKRLLVVPAVLALLPLIGSESVLGDDAGREQPIEARSPDWPRRLDTTAWVGPDGRTVLIRTIGGACDGYVHVKVRERPETVKIAISVGGTADGNDTCLAIAFTRGYKVVLHEPLGERRLVAIDDLPYDRTGQRPEERSTAFDRKVPVIVEFE